MRLEVVGFVTAPGVATGPEGSESRKIPFIIEIEETRSRANLRIIPLVSITYFREVFPIQILSLLP